MRRFVIAFGCALAGCAASPVARPIATPVPRAEPVTIPIAPPACSVEAVARSVFGEHVAWLERFAGAAIFRPEEPTDSSVRVELDMTSLTLGLAAATTFARGPHFFDVARFPTATFASKRVTPLAEPNRFRVDGELTMHGVTRPVSFVATVTRGDGWASARAELRVRRSDFGLRLDGPIEVLVKDEVDVRLWAQTAR